MARKVLLIVVVLLLASLAMAQERYQKPPKEILDVLYAPVTPQSNVSPSRDAMLLLEWRRYPPIADLAQPMLRLAGLRINPNTNGPHSTLHFVSMTLVKIADGSQTKLRLPEGARLGQPEWSADGKLFVFTNTTPAGIELWVGEAATGRVRKLNGVTVNAAYMDPLQWMPDSHTLLVKLVPSGRGRPPAPPQVPVGPNVQETAGKAAPVWTYQDLLKNPSDEDLFDYYATSQLAFVDAATGKATPVGQPAILQTVEPAPDGQHLMVARVHRPYSYLHTHFNFPKDVEVWDRAGKIVHKLASLPLADAVPVDGVPTGPRAYHWRPTEPATLVWAEALDGGDPKRKVPHRDRVLTLRAPFAGAPAELVKTEQRYTGIQWGEKGGLALVRDYERARRWGRTFLLNADNPKEAPRQVWSLDTRDRYKDPGNLVYRTQPNGQRAILQNGDWIYLIGQGASPEGDRPFLNRFNLRTLEAERLFRCDAKSYESVVALLDDHGARVLTRRESPTEPPNFFVRTLAQGAPAAGDGSGAGESSRKALTQFPDSTPLLRGIKKQLVTYKRPDGVQLSFTLYLPPEYQPGTRLPTVVWAYPLEYEDPATAGQITGSTQRFTSIAGISHLFFLLRGYAILDGATMPVVGSAETVNNTYIEQIVSSAKAAIDKAAGMGVTDPDRVGVGGHSYGAFMTANLLAHSDLFRAGIARSGAHNRTLTPFGFQSERRTLWEAPELYLKMSPFLYANKINEPILLIHGEADNNAGTHPIQSERMYQAIRGNRGTVRLVTLPHESHGYSARESVEHTLYEMLAWFDKHVKNAPPRARKETGAQ